MYQPGYPSYGPAGPPSGLTGVTAGLAALGSGGALAYRIYPTWRYMRGMWFSSFEDKFCFALTTTAAILLVIGAILLLRRAYAGRVLVIVGAIAVVPGQLLTMIHFRHGSSLSYLLSIAGTYRYGLELLVPLAAAFLAMLPATGRWIEAARAPRFAARV